MSLVTGVDSSTQSVKVVVRDLDSGELQRSACASHPPGTEIEPDAWGVVLDQVLESASALDGDVVGIGIAAQQHGMVALDDEGSVVRPALLWNDTRSAAAAGDLVAELGATTWADATGSVPLAAFTVAKLRWLAQHEPDNAARTEAVCLPHDWLTWRLLGGRSISSLTTDRGDASGTGYWSPIEEAYRPDLLARAFGRPLVVPTVVSPWAQVGEGPDGVVVSAGTGDNMAAALGLGARPGDAVVSIGTSGVVSSVSTTPTRDSTGIVAGFADATGHFLPLICTLNGAPVLVRIAELLGCRLDALSDLALAAEPGSGGLVLVPYLEGERTPNVPDARGELVGMSLANTTPANLARAAIEGILCGLADGIDALSAQGAEVHRVLLVGGAARSAAVQQIAPTVFDVPVLVPEPAEYVALGAAWQAACAAQGGVAPRWGPPSAAPVPGAPVPLVREQYRQAADRIAARY